MDHPFLTTYAAIALGVLFASRQCSLEWSKIWNLVLIASIAGPLLALAPSKHEQVYSAAKHIEMIPFAWFFAYSLAGFVLYRNEITPRTDEASVLHVTLIFLYSIALTGAYEYRWTKAILALPVLMVLIHALSTRDLGRLSRAILMVWFLVIGVITCIGQIVSFVNLARSYSEGHMGALSGAMYFISAFGLGASILLLGSHYMNLFGFFPGKSEEIGRYFHRIKDVEIPFLANRLSMQQLHPWAALIIVGLQGGLYVSNWLYGWAPHALLLGVTASIGPVVIRGLLKARTDPFLESTS